MWIGKIVLFNGINVCNTGSPLYNKDYTYKGTILDVNDDMLTITVSDYPGSHFVKMDNVFVKGDCIHTVYVNCKKCTKYPKLTGLLQCNIIDNESYDTVEIEIPAHINKLSYKGHYYVYSKYLEIHSNISYNEAKKILIETNKEIKKMGNFGVDVIKVYKENFDSKLNEYKECEQDKILNSSKEFKAYKSAVDLINSYITKENTKISYKCIKYETIDEVKELFDKIHAKELNIFNKFHIDLDDFTILLSMCDSNLEAKELLIKKGIIDEDGLTISNDFSKYIK